jgi:hypothetical protein
MTDRARIVKNAKQRRRYGRKHRQWRAELAPVVAGGFARCARCSEPIAPGEPWDLDHDDFAPHLYLGPSHRRCNRAAPNRVKTSRVW